MTIKEKARVAWEKSQLVVIKWGRGKRPKAVESAFIEAYDFEGVSIRVIDSGSLFAPRWEDIEAITFVDEPCEEEDDDALYVTVESQSGELFRGKATISDKEPYDIAKERWGWRPVGTGDGLVRIDEVDELGYVDSPEQKALQAAAPELADMMRELTFLETTTEGVSRMIQLKAIRLLRKLGVPNVAPWYKGE